ncbi:unnamed protein product [Nesidiocoris tenuis]|uniref:Uncharacterized protein n=1 Tax=Nesidiocoris tenuis TaxID=355587 RepID=A0A6H5HCZ4_9HEMI|nr:unnamed protein product [Nesidiocoris tenuis]
MIIGGALRIGVENSLKASTCRLRYHEPIRESERRWRTQNFDEETDEQAHRNDTDQHGHRKRLFPQPARQIGRTRTSESAQDDGISAKFE